MLSDNPHSGIYKADTSKTLDLNGGNPACNQGGVAVVGFAVDCRNATENPFVNGTLQAKEQGMNLNSNNVVRVPNPNSFRTQDADGGTRVKSEKPSELPWGGIPVRQTSSPQGADLYNGTLTGGWRQA